MAGRDIKGTRRDAAMCPVCEYIEEKKAQDSLKQGVRPAYVRGLRMGDLFGRTSALQYTDAKSAIQTPEAEPIDSDDEFTTEEELDGDERAEEAAKS